MPSVGGQVNLPAGGPLFTEKAATAVLCAAAIVGPIALGATGPWARLAMEGGLATAVSLWAIARPRNRLPVLMPLVFSCLIALQLVPLPDRVLGIISPFTNAAWKVARVGIGNRWGTISIDPLATATAIWRMLLTLAVLAAATDLSRLAWCRKAFTVALCLTCVSIWTLGIVFPFDKSLVLLGSIECRGPIEAEFWKTPLVPPIATNGSGNIDWVTVAGQRYATATWIAADGFGPYIYANHFAGAMCLTVPILLGGLLAVSRERIPAFLRNAVGVVVFAAALWTVGRMATSRAGAGALILGILVFSNLALDAGWLRAVARVMTATYAILLLGFALAMYGAFHGIEQLFPAELQPRVMALLSDGRIVAGRVAFRMFAAAPLLGVGLGTFGELFPRFLKGDLLLGYAHNDYAQWLAETGLAGAVIAATLCWAGGKSLFTFLGAQTHRDRDLMAGPWAGLAAVGAHSAFDWNLHIPANALLACLVAGLAMASGSSDSRKKEPRASISPTLLQSWPGFMLTTACLVAVVFLARDAVAESAQKRLRKAIVASRLQAMDGTQPPAAAQLRAAIDDGRRMARWDPRNAQLAVLIGQAFLHLSAERQPIDDVSSQRDAADRWFATARANSAVIRGIPEPAAVAPASPRMP